MDRSFVGGFIVGILAPLLFIKRVAVIVRRCTGKALFVERREDALALVMISPEEAESRMQDLLISLAAVASGIKAFAKSYGSGYVTPPEQSESCLEHEITI